MMIARACVELSLVSLIICFLTATSPSCISELAMEVIETVVAGPECDSLWAVWHQDEEMDDDEAEARMVQLD